VTIASRRAERGLDRCRTRLRTGVADSNARFQVEAQDCQRPDVGLCSTQNQESLGHDNVDDILDQLGGAWCGERTGAQIDAKSDIAWSGYE